MLEWYWKVIALVGEVHLSRNFMSAVQLRVWADLSSERICNEWVILPVNFRKEDEDYLVSAAIDMVNPCFTQQVWLRGLISGIIPRTCFLLHTSLSIEITHMHGRKIWIPVGMSGVCWLLIVLINDRGTLVLHGVKQDNQTEGCEQNVDIIQ